MAHITLHFNRLQHNYQFLDKLFHANGIKWGVVTKLLCGNQLYLEKLINLGCRQMLDSRIHNLQQIEKLDPNIQKIYIKPTSANEIEHVVRHADMSMNSEFDTISLLSEEAQKQQKTHKLVIMVEMGDLREGVMIDNLEPLVEKVLKLPNIRIAGLGTNLKCLNGVDPTEETLNELVYQKNRLEEKFGILLPVVSGGASAMIPLLQRNQLPKGINHFRIGETLLFGNDLLSGNPIDGMKSGVIELHTQIIELSRKPKVPTGRLGVNAAGETVQLNYDDVGKMAYRALIDVGALDINPKYLIPKDKNIRIIGATSDIIAIELDENASGYKVGDHISWDLHYMGALSLMSSPYIEKSVTTPEYVSEDYLPVTAN